MSVRIVQSVRDRRHARENPFRVERVHTVRYRPQGITWDRLLTRLRELEFRAAICGPESSGKTTLAEDIAVRLGQDDVETRHLQLRRETRGQAARLLSDFLAGADKSEILLVDGIEQLGPLLWRRLRRRSLSFAGLIVTSHTAGRLPTLVACRTDVPLLESIVAELVPDDVAALRGQLPALFQSHGGNIRMCLRALYDVYAGNSESFTVGAEDLL